MSGAESHARIRIVGICGSLSARSVNLDLLQAVAALAPADLEVIHFDGLRELPHFNPDLEGGVAPAAVVAWRLALAAADGVLIASPEYGHSLPGALKNGIDWVIGSGELNRRAVAICASVKDARRGRRGLKALAQTLGAVDARLAWKEPIVQGAGFEGQLRRLLARLSEAARSTA